MTSFQGLELTLFLFQVLQPVQQYLDESAAKDYIQEQESRAHEAPQQDDFKSYCDILREQRSSIHETSAADGIHSKTSFDYQPVKIPKKPDSLSYYALRMKHDDVLTKKISKQVFLGCCSIVVQL